VFISCSSDYSFKRNDQRGKSMIEVIPAIDLKDGKCVRLVQGRMDRATVYYEDPLEAARRWVDEGAPRLHLVDLNGAVSGSPCNTEAIRNIVSQAKIPVQLGGGIREQDDIQRYLDMGVDRLILGTLACQDQKRSEELARTYPGKLILGLDARSGFVAVHGWEDVTNIRAVDLLASYPPVPFAAIIYTDIQRDGMLTGPNLPSIKNLLKASPFPVIASGGISTERDLKQLSALEPFGLRGAILGKALYAGGLTYRQACNAASILT
jgi:phosphoribosylformimino-5-aminoimidazole carboxamide ribotide isomerase